MMESSGDGTNRDQVNSNGSPENSRSVNPRDNVPGPSSERNSPKMIASVVNTLGVHFPPRRLFAGLNSSDACSSIISGIPSGSDCGSEFSQSFDELGLSTLLESRNTGSIKLNIDSLSQMKTKVNTDFYYVGNLPWRLAAKTECTKRTSEVKFFSVYIDCNPESESTLWSCDAVVEFRLISQKPNQIPDFSRQFTNKFNYNSNNWGFPSFMEWSDILDVEKGYIKNDKVVVEARITVQKSKGVRKNPVFNFKVPQPYTTDAVFVIDGIRLHVSKTYLALYSPVFHAMFFSKFSEREKKEIPLEDVVLDEFIELLNVIYPSHKPVSHENVEYLLELGDKYEIQYVINECERFLVNMDCTEEITILTKLVWADQYSLAKLQDTCMRTFKTVSEIKKLRMTEEYKSFSDATKAALLERALKVHKD